MRLPWGEIEPIKNLFLKDRNLEVFGCLSFEERCCAVPERLFKGSSTRIYLLEITDPSDAFPNFEKEISKKIDENRKRLKIGNIGYETKEFELLATEDELLDALEMWVRSHKSDAVVVLDITALPKRFFCFILKRLLMLDTFSDVVVTYTYPAKNGYTTDHLAEDPMTCDHLPGFSAPLPPKGDTLVVSIGYESLSIRSLLEIYNDRKKAIKIILPFPPNGKSTHRLWQTVREIGVEPQEIPGQYRVNCELGCRGDLS